MKLIAKIWNALACKCTPILNLGLFWLQDIKWLWSFKEIITTVIKEEDTINLKKTIKNNTFLIKKVNYNLQ